MTESKLINDESSAGAVSLVWGHLIEHGGGLTDAIVFGRIAGEQAARG